MGLLLNLVRGIATVGLRSPALGRSSSGGYFNEDFWESNYSDVLESQVDKAGNAGQESILTEDFLDGGTQYCRENGENYNPSEFISYLENYLGDSKYNAISIIIGETASELEEAWDASYGGDGIGQKMYGAMKSEIQTHKVKDIKGRTVITRVRTSGGSTGIIISQSGGGFPRQASKNIGKRVIVRR